MRLLVLVFIVLFAGQIHAQKVLSEAQLNDLQTRWLDVKKNKKYLFYADFTQQKLDSENSRHKSRIIRYKKTGKVPFRLWAEFGQVYEFKNGTHQSEMLAGHMAFYYIKDEKGGIIKHGREVIGRLGRSGSKRGLWADLPKAGTYTCVVYVEKDDMLFGKEMTVTFEGYK